MGDAIIYGVALGLAVQFVINIILCGLQLITGGDLEVDWEEFSKVTLYVMLVGAAVNLLYLQAFGHMIIG